MTFKPMLAEIADLNTLRFPVYVSVKLDGIRALVINGVLMSRKLKPIPNKHLQAWVQKNKDVLEGFDGELIAGEPTAKNVFQHSTSIVMSEDKPINDVRFYVFDKCDMFTPYSERLKHLQSIKDVTIGPLRSVSVITQHEAKDMQALMKLEQIIVDFGFEGVMTRDPNAPYKHGRATAKQQYLLKIKRFEDSEGEIIDLEEQTANDNPAKTNALGRTERSSHKAGLRPTGTLGTLVLKDAKHGWTVRVGTGLDDATRAEIWKHRAAYVGQLVKYKFQRTGMKDLPRFPSFVGIRHALDT